MGNDMNPTDKEIRDHLQAHGALVTENGVAAVRGALGKWGNAATVAAQAQPSDAEIDSVFDQMPNGAWGFLKDWGYRQFARSLLARYVSQQPVSGADGLPIELRGVSEAATEGDGIWRSCSGCHELNEGHDTGPRSKVFGCALGNGCSECGGIGAVWDTNDYGAMGDALAVSMAQPQPSGNAGNSPANIIDALNFYADRKHFIIADDGAWDTVSGEPQNLWCDEAGTATVEDGSIARAALAQQASGQNRLSKLIHSMFQSGNSIPVDRITLTRTQYEQAIK